MSALACRALERAVKEEGMLKEIKTWKDNEKGSWYYTDIQEATNTYSYEKTSEKIPEQNYFYDRWIQILPNKDWTKYQP